MAMISLKSVTKIYQQGARPALDSVNLDIERGDFVFLVGSSGSGKTTLLSLLLREEEASDGEVHVAGNDLRRLPSRLVPRYRRTIGFVFQDYKLLPNKTVWQNVAFGLEVIGAKHSTVKSVVPQVLDTVGLTGKENRYPHELSGGEAQRVAIARAYANHPQILLADEPTGNLDPTTSVGIMEVLDAINRTGTTILMATHNEEIVNSMRKRVVELHEGKVVRDEKSGSYDSARYYPDAEVEMQARGGSMKDNEKSRSVRETFAAANRSGESPRTSPAVQSQDEGLRRLAKTVHNGRTGRYGETFSPVEDTLTWGKGIAASDIAATAPHAAASHAAPRTEGQPATGTDAAAPQKATKGKRPSSLPAPPPAPKPSTKAPEGHDQKGESR
ncbi:MAG: ATP-binding cassette domain-containing protein [Bifidobacteriaceae bacterium]|jgi:cell division transport system ATP-binding protein|nr:ATP-binding cassette domain-containing protein [Bifidobacteriaceae bacterium]